MKTLVYGFSIAFLGLLLGACGSDSVVSSTHLPTDEFEANIELYADGDDDTHASVQLKWLSGTGANQDDDHDDYVELRDGDQLWLTTGASLPDTELSGDWFESLSELARTQELLSSTKRYRSNYFFFFFWSSVIADRVHYNGSLSDVDDRAQYTVSLLRDDEDDAAESTVVMPGAFELSAPESGDSLSRSTDPLVVEWLPLEEDVTVELAVITRCANDTEYRYEQSMSEDTGFVQIEPGAIDADRLAGRCNTTLTLTKARLGELDPAYAGGLISARQVRSVSLSTTD